MLRHEEPIRNRLMLLMKVFLALHCGENVFKNYPVKALPGLKSEVLIGRSFLDREFAEAGSGNGRRVDLCERENILWPCKVP